MKRDLQVERNLSALLRCGVTSAACIVLAGAVLFLAAHGAEPADYAIFRGAPLELRSIGGMLRSALSLEGRGVIQLGVAVLIATPVVRVAVSFGAFTRARDPRYVVITGAVLGVLVYSIFGTH
jgi:uncharacterized membrane protein